MAKEMKQTQHFSLLILLALLMLYSCNSTEEKAPAPTLQKTDIDSTQLDTSEFVQPIDTGAVAPKKVLDLTVHEHGQVPKVAEKAHQNPLKTGKMQERIRKGTPAKKKAMRNTMKKKQEHFKRQASE